MPSIDCMGLRQGRGIEWWPSKLPMPLSSDPWSMLLCTVKRTEGSSDMKVTHQLTFTGRSADLSGGPIG